MQAIRISDGKFTACFTGIEKCLGGVCVNGWASGPQRTGSFLFNELVADAINKAAGSVIVRCLGGFCMEETGSNGGPVDYAFSFELEPCYLWKLHRRETTLECIERMTKLIRKASRTFRA